MKTAENHREWSVLVAVLSVVLAGSAACFFKGVLRHPEVTLTRVAGSGRGFGPVVEATLPAERSDGEAEILDLETGRWLTQPTLEHFNEDVGAMMTWIRTNGLNISCRVWSDVGAACVTYNMTVVPVETRCWNETAACDFPGLPVLAPGQHSARRLLLLRPGLAETYVFRTDEGTLGMLRLVGLSDDKPLIKIRYKLLQAREQRAASP